MSLLCRLIAIGLAISFSCNIAAADPSASRTIVLAGDLWDGHINSDATGLYVDVLKRIYEPNGYRVHIKIVPFSRYVSELIHNNVDGAVGMYHPKHVNQLVEELQLIAPHYPIDTEKVIAVCQSNQTNSWSEIRDNPDSLYAWVRGYQYHRLIGLQKRLLVARSIQGMKLLKSGRIDCMITDSGQYLRDMNTLELNTQDFFTTTIVERNLYVSFVRNNKNSTLTKIFDREMTNLIKSGEIKTLYSRWHRDFESIRYQSPSNY